VTANSPPKVEIAAFLSSLDSDQRFRLAVDALARRDNAESERLNATRHYENASYAIAAYLYVCRYFHDLCWRMGIFTRDAVIDAQWATVKKSCASAAGDRSSDRNEALLRAVISQLLTSDNIVYRGAQK